jgi:phosphoribosylanthranilate isomerase
MAKVKISGLANEKDAIYATNLGTDFLAFSFIKNTPHRISEKTACGIISKLPPFVAPVGIFCDEVPNTISKIIKKTNLKYIQLNGFETPEICQSLKSKFEVKIFKFFKITTEENLLLLQDYLQIADYFVIDADFTDNEVVKQNLDFLAKAVEFKTPVFATGKILPENIGNILDKTKVFGVDGGEGLERLPKRKDYDKVNAFIKAVRGL